MRTILTFFGIFMMFVVGVAPAQGKDVPVAEQPAAASKPAADKQAPADSKPVEQAQPVQESVPAGSVARSSFTRGIESREPVDQLTSLTTSTDTVYYFTELTDFEGQTVTHRWRYQGGIMTEVDFDVGGPRWRVWSSKNLLPEWTGTWTVEVVGGGEVIASDSFEYKAAPIETAPAAEDVMDEAAMEPTVDVDTSVDAGANADTEAAGSGDGAASE